MGTLPESSTPSELEDRLQQAESVEDLESIVADTRVVLANKEIDLHRRQLTEYYLARCCALVGRHREAERVLRDLLRRGEPDNAELEPLVRAAAEHLLAQMILQSGRLQEASKAFEQASNAFRSAGSLQGALMAAKQSAAARTKSGDPLGAAKALEALVPLAQEPSTSGELLQFLFQLGHTYYLAGERDASIDWLEKALAEARRVHNAEIESQLTSNLVTVCFEKQDYLQATRYLSARIGGLKGTTDRATYGMELVRLAAAYTESGQSDRAITTIEEAEAELRRCDSAAEQQVAYCWSVKGQALLDLKMFDEARALLVAAEPYFQSSKEQSDLIHRRLAQCESESREPFRVDCSHRTLRMAITGSSNGTSHRNVQPAVRINDPRYVTSDLTPEEEAQFQRLTEELKEIRRMKHHSEDIGNTPGTITVPLKIEYVDDVASFEIKWAAFKRQAQAVERRNDIQRRWDGIRGWFSHEVGLAIVGEDWIQFLRYLTVLSQIAGACAELKDANRLLQTGMHMADFLEIRCDDPVLVSLIWALRGDLMVAAHAVAHSGARSLVKAEIRRSLDRCADLLRPLSSDQRAASLQTLVFGVFYRASREALGADGYRMLVSLVGELKDELDNVDQFRHGIATGELGDFAGSVATMEGALNHTKAMNPGVWVRIDPEFGTALAINRFRSLCPDQKSCEQIYGPFARHIHAEIEEHCEEVFTWSTVAGEHAQLAFVRTQAVLDGSLIVMKKPADLALGYAETLMHETAHAMFRAGQKLKTESGQWLRVKRDIPVASAETYLEQLEGNAKDENSALPVAVVELIELGKRAAAADPAGIPEQIGHVLQYFDDLGEQETPVSYACAAVLVGIAQQILGENSWREIRSYLSHLSLMDHQDALQHGRRRAELAI